MSEQVRVMTFAGRDGSRARPWAIVPGGPYRLVERRFTRDVVEPVASRARRRSAAVGHLAVSTTDWVTDTDQLREVAAHLVPAALGTEVAPRTRSYSGYGALNLVGDTPHWLLEYVRATDDRSVRFVARLITAGIELDDFAERQIAWRAERAKASERAARAEVARKRAVALHERVRAVAGERSGWQGAVNGDTQVRFTAEGLDRMLDLAGADTAPQDPDDGGAYSL